MIKKLASGNSLITKAVNYIKNFTAFSEEQQLRNEYSKDVIYKFCNKLNRIVSITSSVSGLLGYNKKEFMRLDFNDLIIQDPCISSDMGRMSFSEIIAKRKAGELSKINTVYMVRDKHGRKLWLSDSSSPWINRKGDIIGSIGCLSDVTNIIEKQEDYRERLVQLAYSDPLTGIANRRKFFEKMDEELNRLRRIDSNLSVLLIDIDHFKRVNDIYGHIAGDNILKQISKIIKDSLRQTDLPARIGGEEFGILLPDTSLEGAYWVAERICKTIAGNEFMASDKKQIRCTVSIGISAAKANNSFISDEDLNSINLYKAADLRLYIAKLSRNGVSADELYAA